MKTGFKDSAKSDAKSDATSNIKSNTEADAKIAANKDATGAPDAALVADAEAADGKAAANVKVVKGKAVPDKLADAKPTDTLPDPSAAQPVTPAQPAKTADADATVLTVATPLVSTPAPAHIADDSSAPAPTADVVTAALQGDVGKPADALAAKTVAARGEAKPQGPATVADDNAVARTHGQATRSDPAVTTSALAAPATDTTTAPTVSDLPQPAALAAAAQANQTAAPKSDSRRTADAAGRRCPAIRRRHRGRQQGGLRRQLFRNPPRSAGARPY